MTRLYIEYVAVMAAKEAHLIATLREAERQGLEIVCMSQLGVEETSKNLRERGVLEYFDLITPVVGFILHEQNMSPWYLAKLKSTRPTMWSHLREQLSSGSETSTEES